MRTARAPGGGGILITATEMHVGGRNPSGEASRIGAPTDGSGVAGEIDLHVHRLAVTDGGQINTGSNRRSTGDGGLIRVTATGEVIIARSGRLSSRTSGGGQGGNIKVRAAQVLVMDGGRIDSETIGTDPEANNAAGTILIEAGRLEVTNGGQISSASMESRGDLPTGAAGTIRVVAPEVLLSGRGSQLTSSTAGTGRGGDVVVETGTLTLMGGARLDSSTRGGGPGGTVTVTATDAVTVSGPGSGLFTETVGQGSGGDIVLHTRAVQLTDGATVSAKSAGTGKAGNVHIQAAETLLVRGGSTVTTAAPEANGGNISITAEHGTVRLTDSHISAEVNQEDGQGGRVTITAAAVIVERSQVLTRAGPGTGGDITIDGAFVFDGTFVSGQPCAANPAGSCLDASGRVSGRIEEGSPVDISGIASPLPHGFTQATALLREHCAVRLRDGTASPWNQAVCSRARRCAWNSPPSPEAQGERSRDPLSALGFSCSETRAGRQGMPKRSHRRDKVGLACGQSVDDSRERLMIQ